MSGAAAPVRVEVAPATAVDLDAIRTLEGLSPATARLLERELDRTDRCAVVARVGEVAGGGVPGGGPSVPSSQVGEVAGYAAATCHLDDTEVLDVVVEPAWRGLGIGTVLVTRLLALARTRGATSASLEVREGNEAALALYRHLGFVVEGRRPGYYPDGEAALVMWRTDRGDDH